MPTKQAAAAFARAERAFMAHLPDAGPALAACLAADPAHAVAYAVQGLGALSLGRAALRPVAVAAHARAVTHTGADIRAAAFAGALGLWLDGNMLAAAARLEAHLDADPSDALAFKLAHGMRFMGGDAPGMLRASAQAVRRFPADIPLGSFVLGCHAFSLEEAGDYSAAEVVGLAAVEADAADAWGLHAVAHVYEMTGQALRGADWLEKSQPDWQLCNNFGLHVAWHLALFRLELGEGEAALALYDAAIRPIPSDEYRDVANAVSLLVRLEQLGHSAGDRWAALVDHARDFAADDALVFAMLHRLVAAQQSGAAATRAAIAQALDALAERVHDQGQVAARVGAKLARLIDGQGADEADLDATLAALPEIGGSHAQRDVFVRLLAERAFLRGDWAQARYILAFRHRNRVPDRFCRELLQSRRDHATPAADLRT
ncbi:MAG: tetratricopeptide repeat protein [Telmatospirillum sp.]|nr:tetratricopeptide repeat protein [Telmatospirillum sp.]